MKSLIFLFVPFLLFAQVEKFIINDSYVIDPYNHNRVTSESQGYGLLYAYVSNNEKLFENMWKWTKNHLRRKDALFSWNYNNAVVDKNNATDGDLLIAYALLKASQKWNRPDYKKEAEKIIASLKRLTLEINGNYVLMPSEYGFVKDTGIFVYPSYYIPFVFEYLSENGDFLWKKMNTQRKSFDKISDKMLFSFFDKKFFRLDTVSMDAYRLILYSYLNGENVTEYKKIFTSVDLYFKKNGFIPIKYDYSKSFQTAQSSPYCVYMWFYMVYGDKNYLKKYTELKKVDKNNYFCSFLDYFLEKGVK